MFGVKGGALVAPPLRGEPYSEVLTPTEVATIAGELSEQEDLLVPAIGELFITLPSKGSRRQMQSSGRSRRR